MEYRQFLNFLSQAYAFQFLITYLNIRMHPWNSSHKFTSILLRVAIKGTNLIILEYRNGEDRTGIYISGRTECSQNYVQSFDNSDHQERCKSQLMV